MTESTATLIEQLATGLKPVPRHGLTRLVAIGIGGGSLISLLIVLWLWGPRPDISAAVGTAAFWIKEGFTLLLGLAGSMALLRLARPDGEAPLPAGLAGLAVLIMAVLAALQLALSPPEQWRALLMGNTSATCPWLIILLAVPILIGTIWAMRRMAPTRLGLAGAAAGLTAGALSAFVYSISCDERAMPFLFIWYGGAIAISTIATALLGEKLLRW